MARCGRSVSRWTGGRPFGTLVFRRDDQGWRRVDVPGIGRANRAVVVSESEVWVVGDGTSLHWSGGDWRVVPIAALPDRKAQLFGLVAFGGADVWTAGSAAGPRDARGVVERWDGTQWTDLSLPDVAEHWGLAGVHGMVPARRVRTAVGAPPPGGGGPPGGAGG
jgi:hypothetical protein